MSISSQVYADLAEDSYNLERLPGVREAGKEEKVLVEGVQFKVLEQYDNPKTGYQGTIYQRVDSGEMVVGHRAPSSALIQMNTVKYHSVAPVASMCIVAHAMPGLD